MLPVKEPQQRGVAPMRGMHYGNNSGGNAISTPCTRDFRDNNHVFSGMSGSSPITPGLSFGGQTERCRQ